MLEPCLLQPCFHVAGRHLTCGTPSRPSGRIPVRVYKHIMIAVIILILIITTTMNIICIAITTYYVIIIIITIIIITGIDAITINDIIVEDVALWRGRAQDAGSEAAALRGELEAKYR